MDVAVTHFVDAGEQDSSGRYDFYYEGDTYTFSDDGERVEMRTYVDDPATAFFVGLTCRQLKDLMLARKAAHHLASTGRTVFLCLGVSGTYEVWTPERS